MTEYDDAKTANGILIGDEDAGDSEQEAGDLTLYTVANRLIAAIFFPDADSGYASVPMLQRIKALLCDNIPLLRHASRNTARNILAWTSSGSPLRALFVESVGTIALLSLTGLLVFLLFFVAATFNAVVVSLLMSLAAAGGFLALFFTCVAAIYVGALAVAVFVISTTTITAVGLNCFGHCGWLLRKALVWESVSSTLRVLQFHRSTLMLGMPQTKMHPKKWIEDLFAYNPSLCRYGCACMIFLRIAVFLIVRVPIIYTAADGSSF